MMRLGEKHGTITARINDAVNFEVTTLRIDKVDQFGKYLIVELNVPDFLKGLGHQMDWAIVDVWMGIGLNKRRWWFLYFFNGSRCFMLK